MFELLCFAGYMLIGLAVILLAVYFYLKSRERERKLENEMKKGKKDNV